MPKVFASPRDPPKAEAVTFPPIAITVLDELGLGAVPRPLPSALHPRPITTVRTSERPLLVTVRQRPSRVKVTPLPSLEPSEPAASLSASSSAAAARSAGLDECSEERRAEVAMVPSAPGMGPTAAAAAAASRVAVPAAAASVVAGAPVDDSVSTEEGSVGVVETDTVLVATVAAASSALRCL